MNLIVAAVALLALSIPVRSSEEDEVSVESEKYLYGEKEFLDKVFTQPHFVMFFAPWCGHCNAMKGGWNKLAEYYNEKQPGVVTAAKIDCTENKELCLEAGVKGFPTLQLFIPEKDGVRYEGDRTFEDMKKFVEENLQEYLDANPPAVEEEKKEEEETVVTDGLYELSGMHFYKETMKGDTFVLFIQDRCELCEKVKGTWKEIAKIYESNENVKIGQVNCVNGEHPCDWERIPGFPFVKYYHEYIPIESRAITPDTKAMKEYIDRKLSEPPAEIEEKGVVKMTNDTIKEVISHGVTFAKLYHPHCGFCIRMARAWKELGHVDFSDAPAPITIAELDCEEYETACRENGGRGFPTLLAYMDGERVGAYHGSRTVQDMKQYVYELANGYRQKSRAARELEATDGLYNLSGFEFFGATMRGNAFILFVTKGCEYCEKVTEIWKDVAKFYEENENVKMGLISCEGDGSTICESQAIRGYPTMKFYRDGNEMETSSIAPDEKSLKLYIGSKSKEPTVASSSEGQIVVMTDETIKDVISKGVTFVKYFIPGCGFCKRMERAWEKLGKMDFSQASGPVTIAEMNCDIYPEACRANGSRAFPTLALFIDGELSARYQSYAPRTAENMHQFVLEMSNGYQHKDNRRDEL